MIVHIVPVGDILPHQAVPGCECTPERNKDGLWVHNSYDLREGLEEGGLTPSGGHKGWAVTEVEDD